MTSVRDGQTIGSYRICRALGQGGMGAVYVAEHALLRRVAALKVLLPAFSQQPDVVQRFFNEARAASAIRHPGIVEIYDFGFHEGSAYLVMELLEGETLSARMQHAQLPLPSVLTIVRQVAGVLAAAHERGIVHRDLKPDNIFLAHDPEVVGGERAKLLDFGVAKLVENDAPSATRTGAIIGTPTYMAPEQCRGVAIDARADLYALGCVFFELIARRPPFIGDGVGDVLAAHIHLDPPRLRSLVSAVPPAVEQIVHHLLAKEPARRPQRATAVVESLSQLIGMSMESRSESSGLPGTSPPTTLGGTIWSGLASVSVAPRRAWRTVTLIAVLLTIALAGAVVASRSELPRVDVVPTASPPEPNEPALAAPRPVDAGVDADRSLPPPSPPESVPIDAAMSGPRQPPVKKKRSPDDRAFNPFGR